MSGYAEPVQAVTEKVADGTISEAEGARRILGAIETASVSVEPAVVASMLDSQAVARVVAQDDRHASDLLDCLAAVEESLGSEATLEVLETIETAVDAGLDGEDLVTAIEAHQTSLAAASAGPRGGRPSKVESLLAQLTDGDLAEASEAERAAALADFREEVARTTWYRFRERAADAGLDIEHLVEFVE